MGRGHRLGKTGPARAFNPARPPQPAHAQTHRLPVRRLPGLPLRPVWGCLRRRLIRQEGYSEDGLPLALFSLSCCRGLERGIRAECRRGVAMAERRGPRRAGGVGLQAAQETRGPGPLAQRAPSGRPEPAALAASRRTARRPRRRAMEELDGEPTVTVRTPPAASLTLAGAALSPLLLCRPVRPPAAREAPAPFAQLTRPRAEAPVARCRRLGRRGRLAYASLCAQKTWPQRPPSPSRSRPCLPAFLSGSLSLLALML